VHTLVIPESNTEDAVLFIAAVLPGELEHRPPFLGSR